ncbi:MAG: type IX secretion system membrane protein PorP/SprF [Bacteroidia bacterium]|nr:type IX secretion system membrane protein PorP/SprF [Bacteroidia bacterium]
MNLKRTYLLLLFACLAIVLQAQISPLSDQFLINPFFTNPAIAGTGSKAPLTIAARQQWLGFKGAPSWQSATWHSSLKSRKQYFNPWGLVNKGENAFGNIGIGGGLFNVKYGAISQIGLHLDYAYHVYLGKGRLSLGLAPMYYQFIIDKTGFLPPDGTGPDPLIDADVKEILHITDVNAGIHYYSDFVFAGFSVVQLFNSSVTFGKLSYTPDSDKSSYMARSLYLYGGITPVLSENISLEPSVLMKYNAQSGFSFQTNIRATIFGNFQAGLLYRFRESGGFFAGVRVNDLLFSYQFELPLGNAGLSRFTTHQIMVGYLF